MGARYRIPLGSVQMAFSWGPAMCPENFTDTHRWWGAGETGHHVLSESLILLVTNGKHTSHQETDLCILVLDRRAMESHGTGWKGQAQCSKSGNLARPVSSDSLSLSRSGQAGTLLSALVYGRVPLRGVFRGRSKTRSRLWWSVSRRGLKGQTDVSVRGFSQLPQLKCPIYQHTTI